MNLDVKLLWPQCIYVNLPGHVAAPNTYAENVKIHPELDSESDDSLHSSTNSEAEAISISPMDLEDTD